jgi:hypothetical protein
LVTFLFFQEFKLRLGREMRQNHAGFFHRAIIASLCCIILAGCGYKTNPVYVPDTEKNTTQKGN